MKTAFLRVWNQNTTRAVSPLIAGLLSLVWFGVLGTLQGKGTGFIPRFLSDPLKVEA